MLWNNVIPGKVESEGSNDRIISPIEMLSHTWSIQQESEKLEDTVDTDRNGETSGSNSQWTCCNYISISAQLAPYNFNSIQGKYYSLDKDEEERVKSQPKQVNTKI